MYLIKLPGVKTQYVNMIISLKAMQHFGTLVW